MKASLVSSQADGVQASKQLKRTSQSLCFAEFEQEYFNRIWLKIAFVELKWQSNEMLSPFLRFSVVGRVVRNVRAPPGVASAAPRGRTDNGSALCGAPHHHTSS